MAEDFSRKILGLSILKIIKSESSKNSDHDKQVIGEQAYNTLIDVISRYIITLGSAISDSASIKGRIKPDKNDVYKVLKKFMKPKSGNVIRELTLLQEEKLSQSDDFEYDANFDYPITPPKSQENKTVTNPLLRPFFLYDTLPPFPEKFTYDKEVDSSLIAPENEKDKKEILFNQKNKLKRNFGILRQNTNDTTLIALSKRPKIDRSTNPFTLIPRQNPFLEKDDKDSNSNSNSNNV